MSKPQLIVVEPIPAQEVITFSNQGLLSLGSELLQCFVGTNDKGEVVRVISGRSLTGAIGMKGRGPGVRRRVAENRKLRPYMPEALIQAIEHPFEVKGASGSRVAKPTEGYEATVLLDLCQAILEARKDGVLTSEAELRYAQYAEALVRAMAKVGIIALVDEATGYQAQRDKEELQRLLEKYVAQELRPWVKTFPDDYYQQLFRLMRWQYKPLSVKRPAYVGKLTNQIIYERMPAGMLDEMRRLNPRLESGNRAHKHHQHLTSDLGIPMLQNMLYGVVALMRASQTWQGFIRLLERAYPTNSETVKQLALWEEDAEEEAWRAAGSG